MIVVDANVVVAFLLESPLTPEARAVHAQESSWIVPPLCEYEVLNALLQETRARKISLPDAVRSAETTTRLLAQRADGCKPVAILTAAYSLGLTAYDATYVVLARSLGVVLVTEDQQILRACPDVAQSMRQFLAPPGRPRAAKERAVSYMVRRGRTRRDKK